jgi:hypothetical protein
VNTLIEALQTRIAELEKEVLELRRDNHRYENGRIIMITMIHHLTDELKEYRRHTGRNG